MFKRIFSLFANENPHNSSVRNSVTGAAQQQQTTINTLDMQSLKFSGKFNLSLLESLNWLHLKTLCFPLNAKNINIIFEPKIFYNTLLTECKAAKNRIVFSSLYLGTGTLENQLVNVIHKNVIDNEQLKVNILLDYTRGTRGQINSKTLLLPLLREREQNVNISLYHTPALRGLRKRIAPPKWNELIGLQHMKLYLIDDTLIISGANLSSDYFTNRQDRYVMIKDKMLCDFYCGLIDKVGEFSLQVNKNDKIELHSSWTLIPDQCDKMDFVREAKSKIIQYFHDAIDKQKMINAMNKDADTWIFPLIEMGQLDIHHDSIVTKDLLLSALPKSSFTLASGYFNLTKDCMDTITHNCLAKLKILMAHPNANGFLGARFPAGGIPAAYSLIARQFHLNLLKANQHNRVKLFEYERNGWTYHAKGLWYYLPNQNLPTLTLIGSSNFGERSVNRDLETQICIVTTNKSLQLQMQNEYNHLHRYGSEAEQILINRPIPRWVKCVVLLFRNFF